MHSAPWRLTPGGGASLGPAADRVPRARRPCGLPAAQAEQLATAHTAAPPPFRRPLVRAGLTPGAPGALSAGTGMGGGRGSEEERKEAMLQEYAKMRAAAFSQVGWGHATPGWGGALGLSAQSLLAEGEEEHTPCTLCTLCTLCEHECVPGTYQARCDRVRESTPSPHLSPPACHALPRSRRWTAVNSSEYLQLRRRAAEEA